MTVRRVLMAGATLATALLLTACGGGPTLDPGSATPTTNESTPTFNDADVTFAQMMIPHHEQAVEMATLAQTRATDPELKQLAQDIRDAQEPEIATMTDWLRQWGQPTATPGGHNMPGMDDMPGMMTDAEMAELEAASGVDFDRMFARMMIAHHNGAIQMSRDVMAQGSNPDVKALAATIEQTQSAEIARLQAILDRL
ncbi:MAG TPA: DUF305 domain-containing protein [Jiangellales bacterium]|nr:DUF305 domain-containing protein [Jiangellales bacterium]